MMLLDSTDIQYTHNEHGIRLVTTVLLTIVANKCRAHMVKYPRAKVYNVKLISSAKPILITLALLR